MMIGGETEVVQQLDPIFATLAPGMGDIPRTPGREKAAGGTAEQGYLHCGPNGAGHFVKMVHNGIEYGLMAAYAEGLGILRDAERRQAARTRSMPRRRRLRDPEHYQYDLNLRDIAEVWRRGSVDRLVAARSDGDGACWRIRRSPNSPGASPIPAKGAGPSRRRSTKACLRRC